LLRGKNVSFKEQVRNLLRKEMRGLSKRRASVLASKLAKAKGFKKRFDLLNAAGSEKIKNPETGRAANTGHRIIATIGEMETAEKRPYATHYCAGQLGTLI
jgi:hypothetical protein